MKVGTCEGLLGKDVVRKSTGVGLPCWSSAYESPANAGDMVEDPACHGRIKPMSYNYRAQALEPLSQNFTEPRVPRACAPQRSPCSEKPVLGQLEGSPRSPQLEKATKTQHSQSKLQNTGVMGMAPFFLS